MSVFLRWGVFGILAVAALLYAYNASKRLAHSQQPAGGPAQTQSSVEPPSESGTALPANCESELQVAVRALEARRAGEPLDRVLRSQLIAFESDPLRRQRLEEVARAWYGLEGAEPDARAVRARVADECPRLTPAS